MKRALIALLFAVTSCSLLPTRTEGGHDGGAAGGGAGAGAAGSGGNGGAAGGHAGNGGAAGMACTAASCSGATPVCDSSTKMCRGCANASECGGADAGTPVCAPSGRCVECGADSDCTAATKPICDATTNTCRGCMTGTTECGGVGATTPACAPSGACVGCVANTDCTTATKPICDTTDVCRACSSDTECGGPGVCMADGHCATTSEVVFVQFSAAGCPGADGSAATPYCAPNDAVAVITSTRHVIVIVGAANNQMALATTDKSPVVVGRKSSSGIVGSIPATATTAIAVSSDTVLIRDLTVNAGTTPTSTGVLVTGAGTSVTLLRVTGALGTGLGVEAETGTTLTMSSCTVNGNSAGGILLNGGAFDIENSTVTGNGPGTLGPTNWGGIFVNAPPTSGPTKLSLLTLQSNDPSGITCSAQITGTSGVLASGNKSTDINNTCGFSSCGTASTTCGAQP